MNIVLPVHTVHARILQDQGFETFIVGAGGVIGPIIGRADDSTISLTESVQVSKWFADSVSIPVITDADTCFGGVKHVARAVKEYIQAGVAGISIEDQPFLKKKMGALPGKELLPLEEAVDKYRTASDTRNMIDPDFQIISRTDALAAVNANGISDVIKRLLAYKEAGADIAYIEGPYSFDDIRRVREEVPGPLICTAFNLPHEITSEEGRQLGLSAVFNLQGFHTTMRFLCSISRAAFEEKRSLFDRINESLDVSEDVLNRIENLYVLGNDCDVNQSYFKN